MLEKKIEAVIFQGRWLLAPFFIGLFVAIIILLIKFTKSLYLMVLTAFTASSEETIINILTLVDTALLAGLLLIIIFSGYENFVSKLDIDDHEDRPSWMGKVGFSGLKQKLIGAIVAISAVELLKLFIHAEALTEAQIFWKIMVHLTFVISGVLFALTDYIVEKAKSH
ncbi:TIGR00645 family protein [Motilimonas cestriensis]|uniref:TIGR00645 family protein n=1 Tax=Motilimonas TaxID=1914248 RepID=UPI001E3F1BD0